MAADLTGRETRDLVASAQNGDRAAFGALYERFAKLVHGVLLANARPDDVPDLLQDTFFNALQRIRSLRDGPAFAAWICAIARNKARMHHRGSRLTVEVSEELSSPRAADDRLNAGEVLRAVKRLPERYRETLLLRLVEELNGEEIATQLGLSHGTVRVYLHHGFAMLRNELGDRNEH